MRSHKKSAGSPAVERQRPNSLARQARRARIDARPGQAGVGRAIDAAPYFTSLVCIANEDLVPVSGVNQDRCEIAKGKIAASPYPTLPSIVRRVKRLLASHVDISRTLRILCDDIDGRRHGNA